MFAAVTAATMRQRALRLPEIFSGLHPSLLGPEFLLVPFEEPAVVLSPPLAYLELGIGRLVMALVVGLVVVNQTLEVVDLAVGLVVAY